MSMGQEKLNLLGLARQELEDFFVSIGEKPFRASQVLKWIHQFGVAGFDAMTNISKVLRMRLQELAEIRAPRILLQQHSRDGTRKWLLQVDGGNSVEMVFIPEKERGTLCVSSQVGCALDCTFCSTARQGFNRNLGAPEIIGQLWLANQALGRDPRGERIISNVVLMGMGEPLLNFDNVVAAMDLMMDDLAYGLSKRRVTISTAGVVPALKRLKPVCEASLAVSLHAPDDALRDKLVPLNRKYPIALLLDACCEYIAGESKRVVTFEYVMLKNINDSAEQARKLARLLGNVPSKVNLIPFNPFPESRYQCSSQEEIEHFASILQERGIVTITRRTRGGDIDAACGQLVGRVQDRTRRSSIAIKEAC